MEKKALGRGLSALIGERGLKSPEENIVYLNLEEIKPNPLQPRKDFDSQSLEELVASIKEKGILQPIIVRRQKDGYELIAGERRLKAAKLLNLNKIPSIIRESKDEESLQLSLIENLQRRDLNPIEEAYAYKDLMERFNLSQEEIAKVIGKARTTIANTLRLLNLPKEIQEEIRKGRISFGHAKVLLEIEDPQSQKIFAEKIISKSLSVRELESIIHTGKKRRHRVRREGVFPELIAIEQDLRNILGTKVRIIQYRKRGKIEIEFYSSEDLERILKIIKKVNGII